MFGYRQTRLHSYRQTRLHSYRRTTTTAILLLPGIPSYVDEHRVGASAPPSGLTRNWADDRIKAVVLNLFLMMYPL